MDEDAVFAGMTAIVAAVLAAARPARDARTDGRLPASGSVCGFRWPLR